jgi:hypothetical protein
VDEEVVMLRRIIALVACLAILNVGSPLVANAALIGTLQAAGTSTRAADQAVVAGALARAEVRQELVALGVDPATVEGRIAGLTDSELRALADRMADLPAGGDALAVIGIVFLVLLILEAVGVIDIFKKFP